MQSIPRSLRTKEVVLSAVKQNGMELQFAPSSLRADKEVVLEAVRQNPLVIQYSFGKKLSYDNDVAQVAVEKCGLDYQINPAKTEYGKTNSENNAIVIHIIKTSALQFIGWSLINKKLALTAVTNCKEAYQFLPSSLKRDYENHFIRNSFTHFFKTLRSWIFQFTKLVL